jgi:hypothetical protein
MSVCVRKSMYTRTYTYTHSGDSIVDATQFAGTPCCSHEITKLVNATAYTSISSTKAHQSPSIELFDKGSTTNAYHPHDAWFYVDLMTFADVKSGRDIRVETIDDYGDFGWTGAREKRNLDYQKGIKTAMWAVCNSNHTVHPQQFVRDRVGYDDMFASHHSTDPGTTYRGWETDTFTQFGDPMSVYYGQTFGTR